MATSRTNSGTARKSDTVQPACGQRAVRGTITPAPACAQRAASAGPGGKENRSDFSGFTPWPTKRQSSSCPTRPAHDRLAGLAYRVLVDHIEHFFQARDMFLGLAAMRPLGRNLIMLYRLGGRQQSGIERGRALYSSMISAPSSVMMTKAASKKGHQQREPLLVSERIFATGSRKHSIVAMKRVLTPALRRSFTKTTVQRGRATRPPLPT